MLEQLRDGKIAGIAKIEDHSSDRVGMRIVITLKRDAVPRVVLNNLLKHTELQTNFSANMMALVDGADTAFVRDVLAGAADLQALPHAQDRHPAGGLGEQGVVRADADIGAGMPLGAALAHDDVARNDGFRTELLHAEALAGRVAAVAGRAACFLVCHGSALLMRW